MDKITGKLTAIYQKCLDKAADKKSSIVGKQWQQKKHAKDHFTHASMQSPEKFFSDAVDDRIAALGIRPKKGKSIKDKKTNQKSTMLAFSALRSLMKPGGTTTGRKTRS